MCLLISLYKFSCARNLIKYSKVRYSPKIIGILNKIIHLCIFLTAIKIRSFSLNLARTKTAPGYIVRRIRKIKCRNSTNVFCAFLKDEISYFMDSIESVKFRLYGKWRSC